MRIIMILMATLLLAVSSSEAEESALVTLLNTYKAAGAGDFSADRGSQFWHTKHAAPEGAEDSHARSCQSCHGADLRQTGEHIRTGKLIKPMAPSVNPERFTDMKKMHKWLRRNCKWTIGRECTPQEKGDILTYLKSL